MSDALHWHGIGIVGAHGGIVRSDWSSCYGLPHGTTGLCDWISGYCQMFSREVYDRGCVLDMQYNPFLLEDTDFCFQIRHNLGLRSFVLGAVSAAVQHKWGGTCAGTKEENKAKWQYFVSKWQYADKDVYGRKVEASE